MEGKVHQEVARKIIDDILRGKIRSRSDLSTAKTRLAKEYSLKKVMRNSEILQYALPHERRILIGLLRLKPTRTISGVNVIAVMARPFPCPKVLPCNYCPGGPTSPFGWVPQSYTGREPATLRAIQNAFDPFRQVSHRVKQLEEIGHEVSKAEIIIMGGTFPAAPFVYQVNFVRDCLDGLNGLKSHCLTEAEEQAETRRVRCVGLTIETRPDFSKKTHVNRMLSLGATRVELGVQTLMENIYDGVNRGHTVKDVIEATGLLKDAGLKVVYHLMPGLPGSTPEGDLEVARQVFEEESFRPDMLKIYPTLVLKGTELYNLWKMEKYKPYTLEETIDLLARIKSMIPRWVRVMRIQRDVPSNQIAAGVRKSNLRELVKQYMEKTGLKCQCIRCREIGRSNLPPVDAEEARITVTTYAASGGLEFFLEAQFEGALIGFLRLRFPSKRVFRPEIDARAALIRELHVYGRMIPVGCREAGAHQHRGIGKRLLEEAEAIAIERNAKKILVTSGLGAREYYTKVGYRRYGVYMAKTLT